MFLQNIGQPGSSSADKSAADTSLLTKQLLEKAGIKTDMPPSK